MADNFLNSSGLAYFWQKIKDWVDAKLATSSDYGMVKLNPSESVDVNASGQLTVGGRLGQYPNGGVYYPADMNPDNINQNSFLISEAKGYWLNETKSLAVLTGINISCRSAAANSTVYEVNNTYDNRIICKAVEGGYLALNEDNAKAGNFAKVLSVTVNGEPVVVDSSVQPTTAAYRIRIEVDKTVNPDAATTSIRGYANSVGFSTLSIGQCVGQGTNAGGSVLAGGSVYNAGGNYSVLCGQRIANLSAGGVNPMGAVLLGEKLINNGKRFCFAQGTGHDLTNGSNNVVALGAWSDVTADTALAIGNGTAYTARSNLFEVTRDGGIVVPSSTAGSTKKFKLTVDDSGTVTATEVV